MTFPYFKINQNTRFWITVVVCGIAICCFAYLYATNMIDMWRTGHVY